MNMYRYCFLLITIPLITFGCKPKHCSPKTSTPQASHIELPPQTLSINITTEPHTLDPRKMRSLNDINISKMFFEGLTRIDQHNEPIPALADHIEISSDFKTYTFSLRESQWSNQTPVTANDFIYAWKSSLNPSFSAPNAHMLYPIKNAAKIKEGTLPSSLLGAEAIDELTLKIELNYPIPYFLELLSHPIFLPVNEKVDRINPNWATQSTSFVCNGPFLLQEWKHHHYIGVRKNASYWDQATVKLEEIKLLMVSAETGLELFKASELNWSGSPFSVIPHDARIALKNKNNLKQLPNLATHWIRVNTEASFLKSKKMRQALALAVDRQALTDHVLQGGETPTTGIVPITMALTSAPYFKDGDREKAVLFFLEALQEEGLALEEMPTISLLYTSLDNTHKLAQALQAQWRKAFGVLIELEPVERQVFFDRVAKSDYELSIGSWYADFNDPINFLEVFKSKTAGTNNTNWEDQEYKQLLNASYLCHHKEERNELLRQSEKILIDAIPVIPLYNAAMLYLKDDNLKGVVFSPTGTIDFKSAYLAPLNP